MSAKTDVLDKVEIKEPNLYNVILLNDDATPMQFVVQILIEIFQHHPDSAFAVMMAVHEKGQGVAGTYYKEIAYQKEIDVTRLAQSYEYPLRVRVEQA